MPPRNARTRTPLNFSPAPHPIPALRSPTAPRNVPRQAQKRARLVALILSPQADSLRHDLDAELLSALDAAVALD